MSTAAPAGSGWAPKWQAEHPGLAAQSPLQDRGETPGGGLWERSILLPDVLRRQRTARQGGEQAAVPADGLVYAAEEEVPEATAQMVRQITRAVGTDAGPPTGCIPGKTAPPAGGTGAGFGR